MAGKIDFSKIEILIEKVISSRFPDINIYIRNPERNVGDQAIWFKIPLPNFHQIDFRLAYEINDGELLIYFSFWLFKGNGFVGKLEDILLEDIILSNSFQEFIVFNLTYLLNPKPLNLEEFLELFNYLPGDEDDFNITKSGD